LVTSAPEKEKAVEKIVVRCTPEQYDRFWERLRRFKRKYGKKKTWADYLEWLLALEESMEPKRVRGYR